MPANAGIQFLRKALGSRFRGDERHTPRDPLPLWERVARGARRVRGIFPVS